MKSSVARLLALAILPLALRGRLGAAAGEVATWLTRIDDGDAKEAALGPGSGPRKYDLHQDDRYVLFQKGATALLAGDPGRPVRIAIDRRKVFQTMSGHGAAMTDSSAWVLMNLKARNPKLFQYVMTRLFSPTDGAGFSFLRIPMGSSDYTAAKSYFTYCDEPSPDLRKFSIAHDKHSIIPALREALRLNPSIRFLGSPWSPPAWMKTNGDLRGVTPDQRARGAVSKLKPECFEVYADYFVKFIESYRAAGLEVHAVTLQNEPQQDEAHYPCLRMDEDDQIKLVRCLGPKLAARGLKTRIFVHDHNWTLPADDPKAAGGDVKMDPLESVIKIFSDPVAGKFIAGSAWHCYSGDARVMKRTYDAIHEKFPEKQIFCTELSGWGKKRGGWIGDLEWGLAHNWMGGPQNWSEVSLEWNLALDHRFGPTLRPDSEATALVTVNTDRYDEARFEREYYAMAHLSRAAPRGARHIGAAVEGGDPAGLEIVAFALAGDRTSLVVFNKQADERSFQVDSDGKSFEYRLPGRSIVTFIW